MSQNYTTLTLPVELAEEIRDQEGDNTEEKLKNWAEKYERTGAHMWTQLELEQLTREVVQEEISNMRR